VAFSTARLSIDTLSVCNICSPNAVEHLSSPYDGAIRSRHVVVRINQHRCGVHKQMSANLYKDTDSRFAQGISNAGTISGWFELLRYCRLLAAGNRDVARHRPLSLSFSLLPSLSLSLSIWEKNLCADPVADIKMQVVRACAPLFIRLDIGVLWATALCVPPQ